MIFFCQTELSHFLPSFIFENLALFFPAQYRDQNPKVGKISAKNAVFIFSLFTASLKTEPFRETSISWSGHKNFEALTIDLECGLGKKCIIFTYLNSGRYACEKGDLPKVA